MTAIIAIIVLVIVIGVIAAVVVGSRVVSKSVDQGDAPMQEAHGPGVLRYRVPVGQDPAMVVAALIKEGFEAASNNVRGTTFVAVEGAAEKRERVRQVIRTASGSSMTDPATVHDSVQFEDER